MYEQKIAEKVLAKYLKVYPIKRFAIASNKVFVQGLHQKAAENLRGASGVPVQNASNALQAVGLRVTSMLKPCKIRQSEGQVPRLYNSINVEIIETRDGRRYGGVKRPFKFLRQTFKAWYRAAKDPCCEVRK